MGEPIRGHGGWIEINGVKFITSGGPAEAKPVAHTEVVGTMKFTFVWDPWTWWHRLVGRARNWRDPAAG